MKEVVCWIVGSAFALGRRSVGQMVHRGHRATGASVHPPLGKRLGGPQGAFYVIRPDIDLACRTLIDWWQQPFVSIVGVRKNAHLLNELRPARLQVAGTCDIPIRKAGPWLARIR